MAYEHSDFHMSEANVKWADCVVPTFGKGLRLGLGYVNANLDEDAWVALSGTFRDVSPVNGGLPNSALTAPNGGNLTLLSRRSRVQRRLQQRDRDSQPGALHTPRHDRQPFQRRQVVLDGDLLDFWRMDIGGSLKTGLFDNFAEGSITESYRATNNDLSNYYRQYSDSRHQLAFMGGIGVNAGFHITDEIAIRAGYEVLFLSNLALSQEQINGISNTNLYHVQTDGTAVIQSAHAGVEIAF